MESVMVFIIPGVKRCCCCLSFSCCCNCNWWYNSVLFFVCWGQNTFKSGEVERIELVGDEESRSILGSEFFQNSSGIEKMDQIFTVILKQKKVIFVRKISFYRKFYINITQFYMKITQFEVKDTILTVIFRQNGQFQIQNWLLSLFLYETDPIKPLRLMNLRLNSF